MSKIASYYSIIVVSIAIIMCIFDSEGNGSTVVGGVMFIPVLYSLLEMSKESKSRETEEKERKRIEDLERIKREVQAEIRAEIRAENEVKNWKEKTGQK